MRVFVALLICMSMVSMGGVGNKIVLEALEQGAKKSNRVLTPALKATLTKSMEEAIKHYGDDVIKAVSKGGVELLEQSGKFSDDVLKLCAKNPKVVAVLAKNTDNLLVPLASRMGTEVLEFEVKHPGMAVKAVTSFGDDAIKAGLKISHDDMAKLVGYAAKADSPSTQKLLWTKYLAAKDGPKFLKCLNWKHIMATGMTAATVTAAYKVSDGVQKGIGTVATEAPDTLAIGIVIIAGIGLLMFLFPIVLWLYRALIRRH